jgi:AcrR family transcriptional regulator
LVTGGLLLRDQWSLVYEKVRPGVETMMTWKRARSPEQKEARRAAILEATAQLLAEGTVSSVSLNGIARRAGLSKSNLYRYFGSREEVLLALLQQDVEVLAEDAMVVLAALPDDVTADQLAEALVDTVLRYPRLACLLANLTSVIEQNVDEETLVAFKLALFNRLFGVAMTMDARWPHLLPPLGSIEVIRYLMFLLAGLWPQRDPPEVLRRVMSRPELAVAHVDFRPALVRGVALIIRGLAP